MRSDASNHAARLLERLTHPILIADHQGKAVIRFLDMQFHRFKKNGQRGKHLGQCRHTISQCAVAFLDHGGDACESGFLSGQCADALQ